MTPHDKSLTDEPLSLVIKTEKRKRERENRAWKRLRERRIKSFQEIVEERRKRRKGTGGDHEQPPEKL